MPAPEFFSRKIVTTSDGSHTLQLENVDEHYHSTHGALQESMHVFIENGLKHLRAEGSSVKIMEVGFGTGLNALLTIYYGKLLNIDIEYTALEPYPLRPAEYSLLNFSSAMQAQELHPLFLKMHDAPWHEPVGISPAFTITKFQTGIYEQNFEKNNFNLVFFDAFAPDIQPEMWDIHVFRKIFEAMQPAGVLVTYCAKGQVRRSMKQTGFIIEKPAGPPGKREITRALKPSCHLPSGS